MKLLKGLLLQPTLNLLNWTLKRRGGNSLIIGGPLGWSWQATLDTTHHGSLAGPANAHRHADLANIGSDDHHIRDHAARHVSGQADAVSLDASQVGSGRFGLARMPDGANGYVLKGKGAGVNPAYEALAAALVTSGSYSGNSTASRAIAHGLGVTPKIVFLVRNVDSGYSCWYRIIGTLGKIMWQWSGAASPSGQYAVTIADATNFYVGNSLDYSRSANYNYESYYWVALG